jgi:hypothetical protein
LVTSALLVIDVGVDDGIAEALGRRSLGNIDNDGRSLGALLGINEVLGLE